MRRAGPMAAAATLVVWVLWRLVSQGVAQLGDTRVYQHAARMIGAGFVPYRDFDVEYPPLATALFWAVDRLPGPMLPAFSVVMGVCLAAAAWAAMAAAAALRLSRRRRIAAAGVVALTPVLLGALVGNRYDLVLSALLGWTLVAAASRRFGWMWGLLAAATAMKLVPVLLVPALMVWHMRHRGPRTALRGAGAFAAGVAATFVPFALVAPGGLWELFRYHLVRPLQVESLGASAIGALGLPSRSVFTYGSDNIAGAVPAIAAAASTLLMVAAVLGVVAALGRASRLRRDPADLASAFAATLAAAVLFGKVLSPQYLVWLLPVLLLVPGRRGTVAAAAVAIALPLTQLVYPVLYPALVDRGATGAVAVLVLRNALLAVALVAAWPRAGGPRGSVRDGAEGAVDGASHPPDGRIASAGQV